MRETFPDVAFVYEKILDATSTGNFDMSVEDVLVFSRDNESSC